eukprot:jgi/Chlat1/5852/Chrsp4S06232
MAAPAAACGSGGSLCSSLLTIDSATVTSTLRSRARSLGPSAHHAAAGRHDEVNRRRLHSAGFCQRNRLANGRVQGWKTLHGCEHRQCSVVVTCKSTTQSAGKLDVSRCAYMEDGYSMLADHLLSVAANLQSGTKYFVGVAGVPGSGKSTTAQDVTKLLNTATKSSMAVNVPMDGFHFYRHQLDAMQNPSEAHKRRGAHWTFDGERFVSFLQQLRMQGSGRAPSFDHAVKDPVEDSIAVLPEHQVVIVEGNYLLLDFVPWSQLAELFDETWFMDCDMDVAMDRVKKRHLAAGLGSNEDEAWQRVLNNDKPNAELIVATRHRADLVVPSLPFR